MDKALNDPASLCIVSIMKSGTHWMRYLFANYQNLLLDEKVRFPQPVVYERLQDIFSPTDRREAIRKGHGPHKSRIYPMHGLSNVFWQHVDANLEPYEGKIVFIHRNPLDYAVSRYFYDKELWARDGRDVSSIAATVEWSVDWYGRGMRTMADLQAQGLRVLPISYEELKMCPQAVLGPVFRWVGLPFNKAKLDQAIALSDAKQVRKEEEQRQAPILGAKGTHFVRDASVGQWKKHLSDETVKRVGEILGKHNFKLENFITDLD